MAHLSGYLGSIAFTGGGGTSIPKWTLALIDWQLTYTMRTFETPVQGNTLRSAPTVAITDGIGQWGARVAFLTPSNLGAVGGGSITEDTSVGLGVVPQFVVNGALLYSGEGEITEYHVSNPLDGPYVSTAVILGNGVLVYTTS